MSSFFGSNAARIDILLADGRLPLPQTAAKRGMVREGARNHPPVKLVDAIVRVESYSERANTSLEGLELEVRSEVADGVAAYRIIGRIDASTSHDLESAVGSATGRGTSRIVFGTQPAVIEVFEISGARTIIPIGSDETEARAMLGA